MAGLPANVAHGTITGRLVTAQQISTGPGVDEDVDVVALSGAVTFTPNIQRAVHAGAKLTIFPKPIQVELAVDGSFETRLIATDDADLNPTGWTYTVTFQIGGMTVAPFSISVASDTTRDISAIISVAASAGVAITRGASAYEVWLGLGNAGTEADFIAAIGGDSGSGIESVSGTVTLDGTGAPVREFYCTATATINDVIFEAGTAVVWRRTPIGIWGYIVIDEWINVDSGGETTTTTTTEATTTTTTTEATTTTTTTAATTTTTTTAAPEFPATLAGLYAWYSASDASSITTGATMTWNDKSGNARHLTQGTGTKQPSTGTRTLNGLNVLDFDGGDVLAWLTSFTLTQPYTVAVVYQLDAVPAANQIAFAGGGSVWLAAARSTSKWSVNAGTYLDSSGAPDTTAHAHVNIFNGASSSLRIDGASVGTGNAGANSATQFFAGAVTVTPTGAIDGCIAEIVVVSGALSGADLTGLEDYLSTKWGTP